jgi:murein L,D-transpeptidase YafK
MLRILTILMAVAALAGCASKFRTYDGPEVTRLILLKQERTLHLMHNDTALKSYNVGMGFAPEGHKQQEGDGRTPEGEYLIDRRNPDSEFHLSIGISYPNEEDIARAEAAGREPGGDIFIHGRPWPYILGGRDWTAGCIAVSNREIEEIYAMVRNDTPITILP